MALAGKNSEFNWSIKLPDLENVHIRVACDHFFFHERDAEESNMMNRSAKVFRLIRLDFSYSSRERNDRVI